MINKITSALNEDDYNRIQNKFSNLLGYFFWFIFFIFGYSSIYESFARYQIVKEEFVIIKRVSDDHNLRAKYNEFDENLPSIEISFKYNEIQKKRLREKAKKNELNLDNNNEQLLDSSTIKFNI